MAAFIKTVVALVQCTRRDSRKEAKLNPMIKAYVEMAARTGRRNIVLDSTTVDA